MAKIKQPDFDKLLQDKLSSIKAILVYGQDRGQVLEYGKRALDAVIPDAGTNPFSVFNYDGETIEDTPEILFNELSSISFAMERKVITIKDASEKIAETIKDAFDTFSSSDCLLIVLADDLGTTSKLRGFFETTKSDLVSLPCYVDEGSNLAKIIKETLSAKGIANIDYDAMQFLCANLGSNRAMTRSELEKLSLYLYGKNKLTLKDAEKIISDSSALQTADLTYAMFGGDTATSLRLYPKVLDIGETPVILIRIFLIYVRKLLSVHEAIESGATIDDALKINGFRFFKIIPTIKKHIQLWSVSKLLKCMRLLMDTDIRCKVKDAPTEILVSDMILRITKMAARN